MATRIDQVSSRFSLDRKDAVPKVIGDHNDFLIVSGLAGPSKDVAFLSNDADNIFALAGAMGAACSIGLGLALAQPERAVLVVTGDGELLMNVGSLATVAGLAPRNLSILVVDNGHYGETGYQQSHTSLTVDLETMARGAGIGTTMSVERADQYQSAHDCLRQMDRTVFVNLLTNIEEPPSYKRLIEPAAARLRFKQHVERL